MAQLSPDTPALDIAVAPLPPGSGPLTDPGPDLDTGLRYGSVGAYHRLAAGSYAVSVTAAGAPRATPPALSTRIDIPAGGARTVAITGRFADLALVVLPDDLSPPGAASARVRVLAGAGGAGPLDATLTPPGGRPVTLASGLRFPGAGRPVVVPAGAATLRVGTGTRASTLPVRLTAGSVADLVVLDTADGGLAVRTVVDAAGPSVSPRGPVEAGGGGTAGVPSALLVAGLTGSALLAACAVRGRRRLVVAAAAALVLTTVEPATAAAPAAPAASAHTPAPLAVAALVDRTAGGVVPRRVVIPSVGVDSTLVPTGLDRAGSLMPPADPATAGWFRSGPAPGDLGPAVLTGHVDSAAGPGAFFTIGRTVVGDPVLVTRADGSTLRFLVTGIVRYPKSAFPTAEVYGPVPDAELRLITCGGRFDRTRRSYVDNVVVFARLES